MKIVAVEWTGYRVPLRGAVVTARGSTLVREGALVWLRTDAGLEGVGEAAPMDVPDAAVATMDALAAVAPKLVGRPLAAAGPEARRVVESCVADRRLAHAVRAGLDMAAWDVQARRQGVTVARAMDPAAVGEVGVNAMVSAPEPERAAEEAARAVAEGFGTVKLKVGRAGTIAEEERRVVAVRSAVGPGVRLRLDANGAWDVPRAIRTIRVLEPLGIELVEQPVPPGDLEALRRVAGEVETPVAADEEVVSVSAALTVLATRAAPVLVLKPMVVGGLTATADIIRAARAAAVDVVVTTSLDAGVGVAAAVHAAALVGSARFAHGLATGSLLESQLVEAPFAPARGRIALPGAGGLGVHVDRAELERFAVGSGASGGLRAGPATGLAGTECPRRPGQTRARLGWR